jgi:hypothetical protein
MNVLTTTWRQLVRRRLWPIAILLLAALAAVPVLLARDAEPVATPPLPQTSAPTETAKASDDAFAEPVVAKASASDRSRRRRVLGSRKNPFEPAPVKKPKKAKKKQTASTETAEPEKTGGSSAPTTTPTTGAPAAPVTPVEPTPAKPSYPSGSLLVRFGDPTSDLEKKVLRKLEGLPDGKTETGPLIIYTGLTDHGKKAVFLVDASLDATGDGTCKPHPSSCETIELAVGETEFFDVIDPDTGEATAQYEIDLLKINT